MKKILINDSLWQTRIAITRDDLLQNIYFGAHATHTLERSYIKGIVTKILPGIQTAFVDIGQERSGFLHISEIDRELAIQRMAGPDQLEDIEEDDSQERGEFTRKELDISKILSEGEEILVQVSKEPVYEKGAKLTTCFTLPGRFIVLMPNIPRIGISKKIEEREERQRLRELLLNNLPEGMGAIIRTTSENQGAKEILQDVEYLTGVWENLQQKFKQAKPCEVLHEDIDLVLQAVRDHLDNDVELVVCDKADTQNRIYKFVKSIAPEHTQKIRLYEGQSPLFEKYDIEKQIKQALQKKVILKSGGSLVIEATEAMTVIDVNTGRYIGATNLEETILKTNLEAAEEIVRQLRLRNIGGLIVIDFIDMASGHNKQKLFRFIEKTLKERDKFQSVVLRVSEFGLVQMTRKRSGKTLTQQMMETCAECRGLGYVKSVKTESYEILRTLKRDLVENKIGDDITLSVHSKILEYITSVEYNSILDLEKTYGCKITLLSENQCSMGLYSIE
ncbi:MAG: Rne/Rng family ribonuclease [Candidatus Babeliaceae bacterium]|jgi:ribonuclease G